jgi:hypothetical protein
MRIVEIGASVNVVATAMMGIFPELETPSRLAAIERSMAERRAMRETKP